MSLSIQRFLYNAEMSNLLLMPSFIMSHQSVAWTSNSLGLCCEWISQTDRQRYYFIDYTCTCTCSEICNTNLHKICISHMYMYIKRYNIIMEKNVSCFVVRISHHRWLSHVWNPTTYYTYIVYVVINHIKILVYILWCLY